MVDVQGHTSRLGINVELEKNDGGINVEKAIELFETVDDYLGIVSLGKVEAVRLFGFGSSVSELLTSFLNLEDIQIIFLGVQNNQLNSFTSTLLEEFQTTVNTITSTRPDISLTFVVGDEPFLKGFSAVDVESTVDTLKSTFPEIPVLVPFSMAIFSVSFPPENGQLSDDFLVDYSATLSKVDAFAIQPHPFYTVDGVSVTPDFAAGRSMQMLTQQIQATQAALQRQNIDLEITVTATGWPSFGDNEFATPENNFEYLVNAANFALEEESSSSLFNLLFLQELVDQPLKESEAQQDAFGIFDNVGNFKIVTPASQPFDVPSDGETSDSTNSAKGLTRIATSSALFLIASVLLLLLIRSRSVTKSRRRLLEYIHEKQNKLENLPPSTAPADFLEEGSAAKFSEAWDFGNRRRSLTSLEDQVYSSTYVGRLGSKNLHYQYSPEESQKSPASPLSSFTALRSPNPLYSPY
eukprot:snap_masked-scaffold_56-processed-gene-1.37-mRNA-1 protein AED:1.00 eAED:1.00 QI:0/0/0/0/1/1/2/0/466